MTERRLGSVFRAIVLGMSAPITMSAWVACGQDQSQDPDASDAGRADASASDAGIGSFPDIAAIDSYVAWCEAGPPEFIAIEPNLCDNILYVPCGLPAGDYTTDAGTLNRCDQICLGYSAADCEVVDASVFSLFVDSGMDASFDASPVVPPGVLVTCGCYNGGRRPAGLCAPRQRAASPLGGYLAGMAHLEAASVPAFGRMRGELAALGAPRRLLAAVECAIRDEQRHARLVARLAHRFGGVVDAARVRRFRTRSVEAMARENAVEGCVRELYGALVATWQARRAKDPDIRRAMVSIAADETRHAALSLDAARFFAERLDEHGRRRVARAQACEISRLYDAVSEEPHADLVREAGLPSAAESRRMLDALASTAWARDASA